MTLSNQKPLLRKHYLSLRAESSSQRKADEILSRLTSLDEWKNAEFICAYIPTRGEINIIPAIQKALSEKKKVAFPKTVTGAAEGEMIFRIAGSPDDFAKGRFGIYEPLPHCKALSPEQFGRTLCIVPALAFDKEGYRLGYGGGYYDRFLKNFSGVSVGLAYDVCLSNAPLPRDNFDVAVDVIISESEVIRINESK